MRGSGSPVALWAHDFNPVLLTETGDLVYYGPWLQYLAGGLDSTAKWVLENRSEDPGIEDGDAFLCNDPWIGANHSEDVSIVAPVFVEGQLFCWVGNEMHQYDLGGTTQGVLSRCCGYVPRGQHIPGDTHRARWKGSG